MRWISQHLPTWALHSRNGLAQICAKLFAHGCQMQLSYTSTIDFLSSRFPPTLSVRNLSEITTEHEQTIRNKICKGVYPIPSFTIGRKRLFRLIDVAAFIERQRAADPSHPANHRPKRGRPTKVQQLAGKSAGDGAQAPALAQRTRQPEAR